MVLNPDIYFDAIKTSQNIFFLSQKVTYSFYWINFTELSKSSPNGDYEHGTKEGIELPRNFAKKLIIREAVIVKDTAIRKILSIVKFKKMSHTVAT